MSDPILRPSTGTVPGPFLKWAGGKTQLLPALAPFFPERIDPYAEPFLGGGAVFFHLQGREQLTGEVILADANEELINVYRAVRDEPDDLIAALARHKAAHCRDHYYATRAEGYSPGVSGAARTIYLNKTCFNGLHRVNSKGEFNVPMGDYKNPGILDEPALRAASVALQGARLLCQDFRETIGAARSGLIYADPPYVPLSPTSSFTGYAAGGFGPAEQRALAESLRAANRRSVQFVLSNSYTPLVLELYEGFRIERVPARRAINSKGTGRGPVDEAVVLNF